MKRLLLLLVLLLPLWVAADPIVFTASLSSEQCGVGEQVVLELSVTGADADPSQPDIPDIPGIDVQFAGASKKLSILNGVTSSSCSFNYVLTPKKPGLYRIPPISLNLGTGTYSTSPLGLTVTKDPQTHSPGVASPLFPPPLPGQNPWGGPDPNGFGPTLPPVSQAAPLLVECEVSNRHPYVNELVVYTFRFLHRVSLMGNSNYEPPSATGCLREDLGQNTYMTQRDGTNYSVSEVKTAFFPISSGPMTIGPTRLTCQVAPDPFGDPTTFMTDPMRELSSESIELNVQPLPTQGRPPSFKGAVGRSFNWNVSLSRDEVKVGEPLRLEMTINGDCHPDLYSEPVLPNWPGVRVYTAQTSAQPPSKPDYRVTRNIKVPLVALQPGTFDLSGITFSYFDPGKAKYITLTAPTQTFHATGKPLQAPTSAEGSTDGGKKTATSPLAGPWKPGALSWSGRSGALQSPWLLGLVLAPWMLSGFAWFSTRLRDRYRAHQQTREARLSRAIRQLRRAHDLETLYNLAYPALEIRHGKPLKGLPFHELRRELPPSLVSQLEDVEASRYAPAGEVSPEKVTAFRKAILDELRRAP